MENIKTINATFIKKRSYDNGTDKQTMRFEIYEFDVLTEEGKVLGRKWFKETNLLKEVNFAKGNSYRIVLSEMAAEDWVRLPNPTEISWGTEERVFLQNGNRIMRAALDKSESDRSMFSQNAAEHEGK